MRSIIFLKNPSPNAEEDVYAAAAKKHSFDPHFLPILSHDLVDQSGLQLYLENRYDTKDTDVFDALIITSQRAVEAVVLALSQVSEAAKSYILSLPLYTVGPATAALVQSHGFTKILGGESAGNGQILAGQIVEAKPARCLFFTGVTRRDVIPVTLRDSGIECVEKVVYQSATVSGVGEMFEKLVSTIESDVWTVFFSPSGALDIAQTIAADRSKTKVAAIGPTTETFLLNNSIVPDSVSKKPDPVNLLTGIFETY
ncbi:tetrapyrrole biosynthesis, uroporphyrinogen III synthase [Lipomyces arxii]|uniref:tetrapyrrole biosynthesis, uroporphyrinogen III synthase n=1 Tax=Lipomyces arxii TaxID=56418 RepID=UPI0034CF89CB